MWINECKVSKIVLKSVTRTLPFLATVGCSVLHFFPKNVTLKRKLARLAYNKESKESLPEYTGLELTERWNDKFAYQKSLHFIQLCHLENWPLLFS